MPDHVHRQDADNDANDTDNGANDADDTIDPGATSAPSSIQWRPVFVVWAILFIVAFGISMANAPQTRIYEDIICRNYYHRNPLALPPTLGIADLNPPLRSDLRRDRGDNLDESRCKAAPIQDAVNELFGWQTFFDGIPGLLLAMYYGSLADRIGRRPVLALSLLGMVLGAAFSLYVCWIEADVRLSWFSAIFTCVGGGNTVATAASMMMVADATPDASRARIFFFSGNFLVVGNMLGPPVGALLMERDPWIPNGIGFLCMALAPLIAWLGPETLGEKKKKKITGEQVEEEEEEGGEAGRGQLRAMGEVWKHAASTLGFVFRSRNLAVLVGTYFTVDFARESLSLIVRYVSARFNMPLAKASYILSFRATGTLIATTVVLPLFDAVLARRYKTSPTRKDMSLAKISILLVIIGYAILVLSPGIVGVFIGIGFYTLGSGFQVAIKSLLSSMVDKAMLGTIFTTLSLMDTVGALFAGPIDALVMKWALRMEGVWKSLPFMFALGLCSISACVLMSVPVDGGVVLSESGSDEESASFLGEGTRPTEGAQEPRT